MHRLRPKAASFVLVVIASACAPEATLPTEPSPPFEVALQPESPTSADDLLLVDDEEGLTERYRITWQADGRPRPGLDGRARVDASETLRGQLWTAILTPKGQLTEAVGVLEARIGNAPPAVTLQILPTHPLPGDDLTATTLTDDADHDPVVVAVDWFQDDRLVATGPTLPSDRTARGQLWRARAVARDGRTIGRAVEATVRVGNTPPEGLELSLGPSQPTTADTLVASATGADADGDQVTWRWIWSVDGVALPRDEPTLPAGTLHRGQRVQVQAIPFDGTDEGPALPSDELVVANAAPSVPTVQVEPSTPYTTDDLRCLASGSVDPDGDAITYEITWKREGEILGRGPVLEASATARGDQVHCVVAATDARATSPEVTTSTVVLNTPPRVGSVEVTPASPTVRDALAAITSDVSDADGDPVDLTITWWIDGVVAGSGTSLPAGTARRGQQISVTVEPSDAHDVGGVVSSTEAVVRNSPPEIEQLSLGPDAPRTLDPVTATAVVTDPDGDTVSLQYAWHADGELVQLDPSPTLAAGLATRGQVITLTLEAADVLGDITGAAAGPLVVRNSRPGSPEVELLPIAPLAGVDDLHCAVTTQADDPDGDALTYRIHWVLGEVSSGWEGDTLPADQIVAGDHWTCEVTADDGELLGPPAVVSTVARDPAAAAVVAAGTAHTCTVDLLGRLACWGDNTSGQAEAPPGTWAATAAGLEHSCALDVEGGVACWGRDSDGRLDAPGACAWLELVAGHAHTCAVDNLGLVACWGDNSLGQLNAPLTPLHGLSASAATTCGLDEDGLAHCWGSPQGGALFAPPTPFAGIALGLQHACGLHDDGDVTCWGLGASPAPADLFVALDASIDSTCGLTTDGGLRCWGLLSSPLHSTPDGTYTALSVGDEHACAIRDDNALVCWGRDDSGSTVPTQRDLLGLSTDEDHACAISATGALTCWGDDDVGQASPPGDSFVQVQTGDGFSCGLEASGDLTCWGSDRDGRATPPVGSWATLQLGDDHACALSAAGQASCWGVGRDGRLMPPLGPLTALSVGAAHACALDTTGSPVCWGRDHRGQASPVGGPYTALAAGGTHTCALGADGHVTCWGDDPHDAEQPVGGPYAKLFAGSGLTCGLDPSGVATCWGRNTHHQADPPEHAFDSLSLATSHACGIDTAGTEHCWGGVRR